MRPCSLNRRLVALWLLVGLLVLLFLGACSDASTDPPEPSAQEPTEQAEPYYLVAFSGTGDKTTRLSFAPDPELWLDGTHRTMGLEVESATGSRSSSELVRAALVECGATLLDTQKFTTFVVAG